MTTRTRALLLITAVTAILATALALLLGRPENRSSGVTG